MLSQLAGLPPALDGFPLGNSGRVPGGGPGSSPSCPSAVCQMAHAARIALG